MVSLRSRAALPGVMLALLLTAGALFALVLAIGIRGDGPLSLLIGGADGAARLQDREAVAPLGGTSSGPVFGPADGSAGGAPAVLPATGGVPTARRSPARRGDPRAGVPGRRSPVQAPSRPAPVTPAPPAPTNTSPKPAPTAAPAPAVKVRGRGTPPAAPTVPKQRTQPAATAAPAPSAEPVVEKQVYRPEAQPPSSIGLDDGVLQRVPPGPPQ